MTANKSSKLRFDKQADKSDRILEAAYQLFLEQGFDEVSIQEIADRAGVAKGTFYLYYRDKEHLKACIISQKSNEIFRQALRALHQTDIQDFSDQIIFVVDYVLDILTQNQEVLKLIAKNLSFGVFNRRVSEYFVDDQADIVQVLLHAARRSGIRLRSPKILLFMIIELASSTCFSCILDAEPLEIAAFKPYLFDAIRELIRSQTIEDLPVCR